MDQSQLYRYYHRDPSRVVEFIEYLRDTYGLPRPGTALDMGCGPGRLLTALSAVGWSVTGYEPDPDYAPTAGRTLANLPDGRFRRGGFLDLDEVDAFDLIAAMNGPYCYILTHRERREALQRCARALTPGGVLLLELSNFFWILKHYREPPADAFDVDSVRVRRTARHEFDFHRGTMTHHDHFTWVDGDGTEHEATKTHRMAMVAAGEILFFLDELGFTRIATYNSPADREPAELTGRKILVVAQMTATGGS